jgi:hypothetical protein
MKLIDVEWFGYRQLAISASIRAERRGYKTMVVYTRRANGTSDWLLKIFMD